MTETLEDYGFSDENTMVRRRRRRRKPVHSSPERRMIEARRYPPAPIQTYVPTPYVPGPRALARARLREMIDAARRERAVRIGRIERQLERMMERE